MPGEVTMAFSSLFRKASNLLGIASPDHKPPPLDGEIIYCKNNVCTHPPAALSTEDDHYPGYLNIRSQEDEVLGSTLILTWIPNSTLKKNPRSIENSPAHPKVSPRRSPRQEYAKSEDASPGECSLSPGDSSLSDECGAAPSTDEVSLSSCDGLSDGVACHYGSQVSKDSGVVSGGSLHDTSLGDDRSDGQTVTKEVHIVTKDTRSVTKDRMHGDRLSSSSLSSDDQGLESQLFAMLRNKRPGDKAAAGAADAVRQREARTRSGSSRSVTSVEMDGDSLVVVTEEVANDDDAFLDDAAHCVNYVNGHHDNLTVHYDHDKHSMSSDSDSSSPNIQRYQRMCAELQARQSVPESRGSVPESRSSVPEGGDKSPLNLLKESLDLKLDITISVTPDARSSLSSTPTSGPDSGPPSPLTPTEYSPETPQDPPPEPVTYNMSFPENSVNFGAVGSPEGLRRSARDQVCGVFSVDLGQMRSLRIFYSDDGCSSGQLVIASRESQYKILHFHHGGLDRLAETFTDWKFLAQPVKRLLPFSLFQPPVSDLDLQCRQFSVIRPSLARGQSHPEEGAYEVVNEETWKQHMNDLGQIQDDYHLRKAIFFAGLEPCLRHEMWPFLLHYYPYESTLEEREHMRNDRYIEYQNLRKQRESMSEEQQALFWRSVQCTVEKDVVRTDRSHPYFRGADNPNIEVLKSILLNYAVAHPHYGYTQGMSDLLAPLLVELQNEVDAYWCFVGLMQKTIFVSSPKDIDMDKQLMYLRALLELMLPEFYNLLCKVQDGLELLFCHRWILLCFKREFPEADALRMWEACWAHHQTDYFHLFLCVAIIALYGQDVLDQDLPADEMLLHFSSLSMHMNGDVVLRKARGLLHQFRTQPKIPCLLDGLCTLCGTGMWDSGHVPTVECTGNHGDEACPYTGRSPRVSESQ